MNGTDTPFSPVPKLLAVIMDRAEIHKLEDILVEKHVLLHFMFSAMGTASSEILKAFGLSGTEPFSWSGVEYLGYFFVRALSYMSVALVIVMLLRRSGVSIGIYFLYLFIVENLLGLIINNKILEEAGNFLPLRSSGQLIDAPGLFGKVLDTTDIEPVYFLLAALLWIAACLLFCKYRFQKSDL